MDSIIVCSEAPRRKPRSSLRNATQVSRIETPKPLKKIIVILAMGRCSLRDRKVTNLWLNVRQPLSGRFGILGAPLTAVGIYGLLAYRVARRINEIGIRMATVAKRLRND